MPVEALPIIGKALEVESKNAGGQMRYAYTQQDQELAIIREQRESLELKG